MPEGKRRKKLLAANALTGKRLGLSASSSPDLSRLGLLEAHFRITLGELTRTIILANGSILYGGHLETNGITSFLIDELHRYGRRDRPLKVCLAWTVHRAMSDEQIAEQKDCLGLFGEIIFLSPDGGILDSPVNEPPVNDFPQEEKSQSLSGLRAFMTKNTSARVVIGGKRSNFEGSMPGIVEEVLMSIKCRQPLYLVGGFGGATIDIIRALCPDNADWFAPDSDQLDANKHMQSGLKCISDTAASQGWNGFSNGLNNEENLLLSASYRPSEVAALVGRGLGRMAV